MLKSCNSELVDAEANAAGWKLKAKIQKLKRRLAETRSGDSK
jgi:hypothetical protein